MESIRGPIEIAKNIYWVGIRDKKSNLYCNPYLILDGHSGVLIDPGSVLDFEIVYQNVRSLIPIENIEYIISHHQDPDLCSALPLFEKSGFKGKIVTHWRSAELIKYYGINSEFYMVDENNYKLKFGNNRIIDFKLTPYLHFPGAIISYDLKTKVLFSSDLFGAFGNHIDLYADENYMESMKTFHEHYMPSHDILKRVMTEILKLDIDIIASQHGCIIKDNIRGHIKLLRDLECGIYLSATKKNLENKTGYIGICNEVIRRMVTIFQRNDILSLFENEDISMANFELKNTNIDNEGLWDKFFDIIYEKRGIHWLNILEPFVEKLVFSYDISMPKIYRTKISNEENENKDLKTMNLELKNEVYELQNGLKQAKENFMKNEITGLYNEHFFNHFIEAELASVDAYKQGVLYIELDNETSINHTYGVNKEKEIVRELSNILMMLRHDNHLVFDRNIPGFIYYIQKADKKSLIKLSDEIHKSIKDSETISIPITVSISGVLLSDLNPKQMNIIDIKDILFSRLEIAKKNGGNKTILNSSLEKVYFKKKILIVDEDETSSRTLKNKFKEYGVDARVATNGITAFQSIEKDTPDLILSELNVSEINGFMLRERLILDKRFEKIPFVLMSLHKDENTIDRALELKIKNYIQKPYYLNEIIKTIINLLEE